MNSCPYNPAFAQHLIDDGIIDKIIHRFAQRRSPLEEFVLNSRMFLRNNDTASAHATVMSTVLPIITGRANVSTKEQSPIQHTYDTWPMVLIPNPRQTVVTDFFRLR